MDSDTSFVVFLKDFLKDQKINSSTERAERSKIKSTI